MKWRHSGIVFVLKKIWKLFARVGLQRRTRTRKDREGGSEGGSEGVREGVISCEPASSVVAAVVVVVRRAHPRPPSRTIRSGARRRSLRFFFPEGLQLLSSAVVGGSQGRVLRARVCCSGRARACGGYRYGRRSGAGRVLGEIGRGAGSGVRRERGLGRRGGERFTACSFFVRARARGGVLRAEALGALRSRRARSCECLPKCGSGDPVVIAAADRERRDDVGARRGEAQAQAEAAI